MLEGLIGYLTREAGLALLRCAPGYSFPHPVERLLPGCALKITILAPVLVSRELKAQSVPGSYLLLTCPPTPEEKRASDQEGWKLYHAHFEEPEDTHKRCDTSNVMAALAIGPGAMSCTRAVRMTLQGGGGWVGDGRAHHDGEAARGVRHRVQAAAGEGCCVWA